MTQAQFDRELIARCDVSGPRYTSYPTANQFRPDFRPGTCVDALAELGVDNPAPLSLYLHVPFCNTICYYCACNKIVTKNRKRCDAYVDDLLREIRLYGNLISSNHSVEQLHFGGGTPTYLSDEQFESILSELDARFTLMQSNERDYSVEVDPRTVDGPRLTHLAGLGFNRLSLGVQDLDPIVQHAVNRFHTEREIAAVMESGRNAGFQSVNIDLIYGLPRQTPRRFESTIRRVTRLRPDRVALYSYAHLPRRFKTQKQIRSSELPSADAKLTMLSDAVAQLTESGYEYVGMDHFARSDDPLIKARRSGSLHRNFQGYTTHGYCDLIGLGSSAISSVGTVYWQNTKDLPRYASDLDHGRLPVERGVVLTRDDEITRSVIQQLMCDQAINLNDFESEFEVPFATYFEPELERLSGLQEDGLVDLDEHQLKVTAKGQYLLRNVAMVFDTYLSPLVSGFSKAI